MSRYFACAGWLLLAIWLAPLARGGEGQVQVFPRGATPPPSGIRLTIDDNWVAGPGYRPFRFKIENYPLGPTTADRTIDVELVNPSRNYSANIVPQTVSQSFVLPEGESSISVTFSAPRDYLNDRIEWKVWVDGSFAAELSGGYSSNTNGFTGAGSEYSHRTLIICRNAPEPAIRQAQINLAPRQRAPLTLPDLRAVVEMGGSPGAQVPLPDDAWEQLRLISNVPMIEVLPPDCLPEQWIDLSMVDTLFIPLDDLKLLATQEPKRFVALREWLATGTTLVVFGVGAEQARLAELEQLLGVASEPAGSPATRGWQDEAARFEVQYKDFRGLDEEFEPVPEAIHNPNFPPPPTTPGPPDDPYGSIRQLRDRTRRGDVLGSLYRPFGLGTLVAMPSASPLIRDLDLTDESQGKRLRNLSDHCNFTKYQQAFSLLSPGRDTAIGRTGVSLVEGSSMYGGYNVPGVGAAPTNTFRVLITLFVIIIGPVCYFTFLRMGRLYLMLVAVPAGAALITFSLFGYAFIADGLSSYVRIASYTYLDQQANQTVSYARQTYYAGLAPSRGMTFPGDTVVLPIDSPRHRRDRGDSTSRRMAWNDEGQHLAEGYFPSRIHAQLFTLRSTAGAAKLEILPGPPGSNTLRVKNGLDTELTLLVIRDIDLPGGSTSQTYICTDPIPAGGEGTATPLPIDLVLNEFARKLIASELATPMEHYGPRGRMQGSPYNGMLGEKFSGARERHESFLPVRHFRALASRAPHVPVGAVADETASLHLVEGTW